MPYPLPLTRTEAYLAYKAGVVQLSDLKPSLAVPRNGIDEWLAYWTGLAADYPKKPTVNLFDKNKITVGVRVSTSNGGTYPQAGYAVSSYIPVSPLTTYVLVCGTAAGGSFFSWYDSSKHYISGSGWHNKMTWKSPANARYIKFDFKESEKDIVQFEKAPLSPYSPYTNEPLILQEEEVYIAYLCGVINEYPEKCLRRVGAYLRYLISARWGRPDHPLNREELYLSLIKTQFIPSGDPSSDIVINGTAKAPFVDVKMYGDTFQQSYTGKNLFPSSVTWTINRAFPNSAQGGWANWAGYYGFLDYIEVEPDTTYTFSNAEHLKFIYGLQYYDSDKNWISGTNDAQTFTTPSNCHYIRGAVSSNTAPTQCQLELGSTATSYEPFVGGQPSPSPDYPQQIQTVTGEQTVEIVGKNLFDKAATTPKTVLNGDGSLSDSNDYSTSDFIPVKPSTAYYKSQTSSARFKFYDQNKTPLSSVYDDIPIAGSPQSFTTPNNCYYIRFSFATSVSDSIQIELGSATTYAPYSKQTYTINLGSLELCKLGTYQDYIWKDGEEWKVHKATEKTTLDGSEAWYIAGGNAPFGLVIDGALITTSDDNPPLVYCDKFYPVSQNASWIAYNSLISANHINGSTKTIRIRYTAMANLSAFLTWLSNNNTALYYVLATPTDTTITDTNLIAQLEALVNGGAEDGTTYIKVNATDPNLSAKLYVEAPKYA